MLWSHRVLKLQRLNVTEPNVPLNAGKMVLLKKYLKSMER